MKGEKTMRIEKVDPLKKSEFSKKFEKVVSV